MGQASAVAQKLQTPVTSSVKFSHSDQVIYLMVDLLENAYVDSFSSVILTIIVLNNGLFFCRVVGFLKMGWKNLFIFDTEGSYIKRHCFCCLDFYIHESKQRQGYGKKLFDFMLRVSNITSFIF